MGSPLWKNVNFVNFWTSCFYNLERLFFVLEYRKRHFFGLYCLKNKVGKMAILGPKPWINPFGKMSIFRVFEPSFFYSLKRCFFVLEYRKRRFPGLYCDIDDIPERKNAFLGQKNKKFKKWKIDIFLKGLTHGFAPRMAICPTIIFWQDRPGKCLLRDCRTKKRLSRPQNMKFK